MSTGFGRTTLTLGTNAKIAVAAASAGKALPNNAKIVLLSTNTDCYVKWGNGAQTATATEATGYNLFMPAGTSIVVDLNLNSATPNTHIAAIRNSADGVLSIHEVLAV